MIEWMQRHRKYLVVTIWISTIAFVGAGFVGWGAYSLRKDKASSMASVGHREVSVRDFNLAYSNMYSYYNNMLNGSLTKEKAQQMGLESIVLNNLVNDALLLNYADDLGLKTLDGEIKKKLASSDIFKKDGMFNIEQYKRVLKNIGLSPKDYEDNLKQDLLLEKLNKIVTLNTDEDILNLLASAVFMEDKIAVEVLEVSARDIKVDDKLLEKFWQPMKDSFLTQKSFDIQTYYLDANKTVTSGDELLAYYDENKHNFLDKDGKIQSFKNAKKRVEKAFALKKTKKEALKSYLKIKKGELALENNMSIKDSNDAFKALKSANEGDVLKPVEYEDGYLVSKLVKINEPKVMGFDEAKPMVKERYIVKQMKELLQKKAKDGLESFKGKNIGFVSVDSNITIPQLTKNESQAFLGRLFTNNHKKSYVILGNKAVIYEILEQKLLSDAKIEQHNKKLTQMAQQFENEQVKSNLLEELRKRYDVTVHYNLGNKEGK